MRILCQPIIVGLDSRRPDEGKAIFINPACRGSLLYDLGNASDKNRCCSHNNASLKVYSKLRTCLLACCSRNPFLVLQKIVFVALAVPSYIMPQRSAEFGCQ